MESNVDCLIIGAGPSGLFCANGLAKQGITVRVVDKRPERISTGHADGIQPRTIEIFQSYGLAERFLREANQIHMAAFYNPGPSGGIEVKDRRPAITAPSTARYPFKAALHQGAIEAIFLDSLQASGVYVDRPTEPISLHISETETELLDPNSYPIRVVLNHLDPSTRQSTTETLNAKYVVGADGAESWVRKTLGIAMVGERTSYVWGVVDLEPETDFPDIRNWCSIHSDDGSCMIIPREQGKVRLYIQLGEGQASLLSDGRADKAGATVEQLLLTVQKILKPYYIRPKAGIDWWTIYKIGQRVASSFSRHERIFIVGDACHTHSAKAGQGMNASMSDSHNLAWKLVHCIKGTAKMSLLKTYESERHKYAQDLIDFDKKFSKLFSGKPWNEINQDGVSHEEFLQAIQTFGGFTSGISVHYDNSLVVDTRHQTCATKLIIGERMLPHIFLRAEDSHPVDIHDLLLADGRFKIIIFLGNTSDDSQRRRVHDLAASLDFLNQYSMGSIFDIIAICAAQKGQVYYKDMPNLLKQNWTKVLIDDMDASQRQGGDGYSSFGIDPQGILSVVVRPDGYIGAMAPLAQVTDIKAYLDGFLSQRDEKT
ncbi:FAD binding domain-containing protein [Mycena floridula]|nr:FAD binding domain-containing protein [Mycena floridula]